MAMDIAKVAALIGRTTLSTEETAVANVLYDMALRRLQSWFPKLRPSVPPAPATVLPVTVDDVLSGVLARLIRNPSGARMETSGDYSIIMQVSADPSLLDPPAADLQLVRRAVGRGGSTGSVIPLARVRAGYLKT